jgi:tRNA-dihydrouridine synthase
MAHVKSFLKRNRASLEKIEPRDATPVQIQILSGSERNLHRFLSGFEQFPGFAGFNLNLSCPSREVIRQGKGAAMIKRAAKTARLVSIIREYGQPVSIKIRLGLNLHEKENKLYLNNLGGVDPDFFVVHAKHATQASDEEEDNMVYPECVEAARGIPIIANGGIETSEIVRALAKIGVAGVMIGRPALRNPAIFDHIKNELGINDLPRLIPTIDNLKQEYQEIYKAIGSSTKHRSRFMKVVGKHRPRY